MIKYRTDLRTKYEAYEVVKETDVSITFLDSKGNKKNEVKNGSAWKWHDSELEAIEHLETREKSLLNQLELQVIECKTRLSGIKQMKNELLRSSQ